VRRRADRKMLVLRKDMPPNVDVTVGLRDDRFMGWIGAAFETLLQTQNRVLRVIGAPPRNPDVVVEVMIDETPIREAMYAYSVRILTLSIIISLITAGLLYLSLQWLMVRPIRQITESMMDFRENPEDEAATLPPSRRRDEIGLAQRELTVMQSELRAALRQKTRLATLGAAVAKINHDLRNSLATAMLASDRLAGVDDPRVQQVAPRLYSAIDRAVDLCGQTLGFVNDARPPVRPSRFRLDDLLTEMDSALRDTGTPTPTLVRGNARARDLVLEADREQMYRVLANLTANAGEAGAQTLRFDADADDLHVRLDVADDGPGLPQKALSNLFQPFTGSARQGGTGLGLVIARDIVHAHGGELALVKSDAAGTTFRIELPARCAVFAPVPTTLAADQSDLPDAADPSSPTHEPPRHKPRRSESDVPAR